MSRVGVVVGGGNAGMSAALAARGRSDFGSYPEEAFFDDMARVTEYRVTCGITLTFGGLFYVNYPGGAGLSSGTVFGRTAGGTAARGD